MALEAQERRREKHRARIEYAWEHCFVVASTMQTADMVALLYLNVTAKKEKSVSESIAREKTELMSLPLNFSHHIVR